MSRMLSLALVGLFVLTLSAPASAVGLVTKIEDIQQGTSVTLQGKVTRILDETEFLLWDETGSVTVFVGLRNRMLVEVGEEVTVRGFVEDHPISYYRPEIDAKEIIRGDGSSILLNRYAAR